MANTNKYPFRRNLYIILTLTGLVCLFVAVNYLIIIPQQQDWFNKKAFRILQDQTNDFAEMVTGYATYYKNYADTPTKKMEWKEGFNDPVVFMQSLKSSFDSYNTNKKDTAKLRVLFIPDSVKFINSKSPDEPFYKNLGDFIQPIQSMHERIFEHVLLVKHDTLKRDEVLLYRSPNLALDYDYINLDSVLKKGPLHLSSITDIVVNGVPYKMFLCPFKYSDQTFILGGLLSSRTYRQSLTASSYPVIITIASLVILIIISFPFLKIYFLSRRENINITDVRTLVAAFLLGPSFFVLLLGTGYMYTLGDKRTTELLASLHTSVQRNFYGELDSVVKQMREFDKLMDTAKFSKKDDSSSMGHYDAMVNYWQEYKKGRKGKRTYSFSDLYFYPATYKNMDAVTWTDSIGRMIAKWSFIDTPFSYLSLRERQYFKDVRDGNLIALPNHPTKDSFAIQPTISWATGGYTINISARSKAGFKSDNETLNAKMILISANMYSVFNPVTPKGFGFCIVDGRGNTLFHSESSRSMHENILKETDGNDELLKAIRHKDSVYINNITLYGLSVKMMVTPMKNLRYYMISYYQNREQNLFVFHIAAFTFFCTLTLFAAFLVFLLAYYISDPKPSRLLFEPGNPDWMMPKPSKANYYKQLILFELLLLGFVTVLFLFAKQFNTLAFTLVDVAIFLPFLTITGYYIIKNNLYNNKPDHSVRAFFVLNKKILLFYLFTLLIFLLLRKYLIGSSNLKNISIAALISICLLAFFFTAIFKKDSAQSTEQDRANYLQYFTFATFLAVVIMSIIPTTGFMYYAFNKELPLQIKTRQLYLSENIERKTRDVDYSRKKRKWSFHPGSNDSLAMAYDRYQDSLKYSTNYGIYAGYSRVNMDTFHLSQKDQSNNRLYRLVTNYLFLPADHLDFVSDSPYYYYWFPDTLFTTNLKYGIYDTLHKNNAVRITNNSPKAFVFFSLFKTDKAYVAWLYLIAAILFVAIHFFLIRSLAKKIFLLGYFRNFEPDNDWLYEHLSTDKKVNDKVIMPAQTNMSRQSFDHYVESIIEEEEKNIANDKDGYDSILKRQFMLEKSYDRLWSECSTEEKFILYDYALDGFTNYKNTDFLFRLCMKGLLRIDEDGQLRIITYSFRNYLIAKTGTDEINQLKRDMNIGGTWSSLRSVFYFLLFGIAVFLIVTQQEIVTTRLLVIIPALATLLPQIIKLFDKGGSTVSSADTKSG